MKSPSHQGSKLATILRCAKLGAWDWNVQTNEVLFDELWLRMLGLDPVTTEQSFKTWQSRIHPDDLAPVMIEVEKHLADPTTNYEVRFRMRHQDGHWVWILAKGAISTFDQSGKPLYFSGIHMDITDQMIEDELRRTIEEMGKIGAWKFDLASQKISWSDEVFKLFPEKKEQGPPGFERHLETIHPDDRPIWQHAVHEAATQGTPYKIRFRSVFPDGSVKWLKALGKAVLNADGKVISLYGTCQDISDKVAEELSKDKQRTELVKHSKLSSLGQMAASVAHEINNPLAILDGSARILQKKLKTQSVEIANENLDSRFDVLFKAIHRIQQIITGMKRFSTMQEAPKRDLAIKNILKAALTICEIRLQKFDVMVELSEIPPDLHVYGNDLELEQIFVNLVNNSIDAVKDLTERWIRIEIRSYDRDVQILFYDSGNGVPESLWQKVFEPFFTTKKVGEGNGLGLALCYTILQEHAGNIHIEYVQPKKAGFLISLPVSR